MKNKEILVSAIVSTYNSELFIKGKIEDLLAQTIADRLEIIIVNSGSKQNEDAFIKEYLNKHSNIKYIKTDERETIYKAWNRGIKASHGKFITNANTDDRLKTNALQILSENLQKNHDVALVYGNQLYSHKINQTFEQALNSKIIKTPDFDKILQLDLALIGSQPMWRASLHFEENIWFDENYEISGDHDFELKVALNHKIKKLPDVLGTFYKSKKTNKSYENADKTNAEVKKVRYINTKRYVDSFNIKESEELLKKTLSFTKIPICLFLLFSKLNSKIRAQNPIFTLEFIYLFTALILIKVGDIKHAWKICRKYLKIHSAGSVAKVYKSILNMKQS